ncbi:hypothetical protein sos41_26480 [Alphaproteobacteria bacterium SO-S41]|nr:hypothetical protein sos41_26480 [Alphaproteobacteria bacterium SO-S41]
MTIKDLALSTTAFACVLLAATAVHATTSSGSQTISGNDDDMSCLGGQVAAFTADGNMSKTVTAGDLSQMMAACDPAFAVATRDLLERSGPKASYAAGPLSDDNGINTNTAVGRFAIASGTNSTALGNEAQAATDGVAVGNSASANVNAVAAGWNAAATVDGVAIGILANAANQVAVAIGREAYGLGSRSVALGYLAKSLTDGSVALGTGATTDGSSNTDDISAGVAVGRTARTTEGGVVIGNRAVAVASGTVNPWGGPNAGAATAVGADAVAVGTSVVALGTSARSGDISGFGPTAPVSAVSFATAIGAKAIAGGNNATSLGYAANSGIGSVSIGASAGSAEYGTAIGYRAVAVYENAVALGSNASSPWENGVALGGGAVVNAFGAVALGAESVANDTNTVSVGNASLRRRITRVADAVTDTDAVTFGQVKGLLLGLPGTDLGPLLLEFADLKTVVAGHTTQITTLQNTTADHETRIGNTETRVTTAETRIENHEGRITTLETTGAANGAAIGTLQNDLNGVKTDVAGVKTDVAGVKTTVANHEARITGIEGTLGSLGGNLTNFASSITTLNTNVASLQSYTSQLNTRVTTLENSFATLSTDVQGLTSSLERMENKMDAGFAMAASLTTITPSGAGKTTMRVGYGYFNGESAVGVSMAHRFDGATPVIGDVGISTASGGDQMIRAGLGVEF